MLINLTPDIEEIEKTKNAYKKEFNIDYVAQPELLIENGIYRESIDFNFSDHSKHRIELAVDVMYEEYLFKTEEEVVNRYKLQII